MGGKQSQVLEFGRVFAGLFKGLENVFKISGCMAGH